MIVVAGFAAGLLTGAVMWRFLRGFFADTVFARENHRGLRLPTAVGSVVVIAAVVVAGLAALVVAGGWEEAQSIGPGAVVLATVAGLAVLGLVDDLAGTGEDGRGFRGHLRALATGRLTTGGLKLVGGGALALAVTAPVSDGGLAQLLVDAAVVALAANTANLFDRAPGRTLKVALVAFAVLGAVTGAPDSLAGVAVVVGAAAALLPGDLGERLMLGDTGANPLGGVLGLGVVLACSPGTRLAVLAGLVALNAAGEVISFSRIIDAVGPLRALDRAGRRR